ncbi:MAG: MFS transporter [Candidatus Aminicenantales bacterium]
MRNNRKTISGAALGLAFVLFLAILILDFADQSLLSPLVNPLLQDFFQSTARVVPLGWVTFTFTILSAASMVIAGIYADRKSRLKICFTGCLLYSSFSALTILIPHGETGYVFFFITRALNGIGVGVVIPAVFSLVGDTVHPERRSTAFGFVSVAMLAGRLAGFVLAGALTESWRMAYFIVGVLNFILAFGLLGLREPNRGAEEEELRGLILEGAEYRFRIKKEDLRLIRSARSNFWLILNFIDVIPGSIVLFLIFKYMKDIHNMEARAVNGLVVLVFLFGALGALAFGRLGDWGFQRDKRAKVIVALFCNSFPIVFMWVFLQADFRIPAQAALSEILAVPGMWTLTLAIAAAMFINQGVNPNWYSTLTDVNLPEHRATIISLASVMDMIGYACGPLIASYAATLWGLRTAMACAVFFWVLNIFFWLPVLTSIRRDLKQVHRILSERALEMRRLFKPR